MFRSLTGLSGVFQQQALGLGAVDCAHVVVDLRERLRRRRQRRRRGRQRSARS